MNNDLTAQGCGASSKTNLQLSETGQDTQARRKDAELIEPSTVRDWFGATQPYVMNIIVANIDSRELRITFVYVWVGTDNPRRSGVFWSPWDDYDAQL